VYNEVKHLPDANNTFACSEADVFLHFYESVTRASEVRSIRLFIIVGEVYQPQLWDSPLSLAPRELPGLRRVNIVIQMVAEKVPPYISSRNSYDTFEQKLLKWADIALKNIGIEFRSIVSIHSDRSERSLAGIAEREAAVALARARDWARTVTRVLVQLDITPGPEGAVVQSLHSLDLGGLDTLSLL